MLVPWQVQDGQRRNVVCTVARDAPAKPTHGRYERRVLWALGDPAWNAAVGQAGSAGTPWPHTRQVCRIERRRIDVRTGEIAFEVGYAVTSLSPEQADARRLADLMRAAWGIENRLHWVRDVTFDEDRCQVRSGAAPQALACCRNLVIALLRRAGCQNIAAGLRTYAARPRAAVALVLGYPQI